jgi:hypothetical protein
MNRGRNNGYWAGDPTKLKHPVIHFLKLHLLVFIFISSPRLVQAEFEIRRAREKVSGRKIVFGLVKKFGTTF